MAKSWELSDEQKQEHAERSKEIGAQYDQETGNKKESDPTGEGDDTENMDNQSDMDRGGERQRQVDDDNVR